MSNKTTAGRGLGQFGWHARPVETATLGAAGPPVSVMGLGLAALGRPGYINLGHGQDFEDRSIPGMEANAHSVLDAAFEAGIRYFDAARSYGRAEDFLSSWLRVRGVDGGDVAVGSKWGYTYTAGWRADAGVHEVKDHSVESLRRQLAETRARLGEWLDLYQIHSATLETGVLDDNDVLGELVALKESGIAVGLSVSGPRQADTVRAALSAEVAGVNPFTCVQATWNLLERSVAPALADAHDAGWGVIVKEAVANGRLTERSPALDPVVAATAARLSVSVDALAIASAVAQPWCDVVLSGATTIAQLGSNIGALAVRADDLSGLDDVAEAPEEYWRTRSRLPWN
jgi:aryl-alcohol dehydrogenase-like predicted oxidoreductase